MRTHISTDQAAAFLTTCGQHPGPRVLPQMCLSPRSEALTENNAELHRPQVPGNMRQATSVGDTMSPHSQRLWQWLGLASCKHPFYLMGTSPLLTAPSPGLVIRNSRSCDRRLIPSILLTSTSNQIPNQFQSSEHTIVQVEQEAAHIFVIHFPSSVCFILRNDLKGRLEEIVHTC